MFELYLHTKRKPMLVLRELLFGAGGRISS